MMQKKKILLVLMIFFSGFYYSLQNAKGLSTYCIITNFTTEKNMFYYNDNIMIDAIWELNYGPTHESYVQLRLFNMSNSLLWNSSEYHDLGLNDVSWLISLQELNLTIRDQSIQLKLELWYYFFDIDYPEQEKWEPRDIIEIQVFKKPVFCQLIGFKNQIKYGAPLIFQVKFYENTENFSSLINLTINFNIISDLNLYFNETFTTDLYGIIRINVSNFPCSNTGKVYLVFLIKKNGRYNESIFKYEIFINSSISTLRNSISFYYILPIISISSFLILLGFLVIVNKKRSKIVNLMEITFKY